MTNQNNAAQLVLTDEELREIQGTHLVTIRSREALIASVIVAGRAIEQAVLSKLRAPVADERDDLRGALRAFTDFAAQRRAVLGGLSPEMEAIERRAIIALASAPVAGEAQPVAYLTLDEEGSPCMLFFDVVEARTYCALGEEPVPLFLHAAPQASEAVRDAVDVALPLLPKGHARNSDVHPDSYAYDKWQLADYARAAILADRQRGADPVIGHITVKGKGRSSVDLDASHADLPEGEYVIRAALSAQPGAQRTRGCE